MLLQVYEDVKAELKLRGGYIMTPEECKKAGNTIIKEGRLNAGMQAGTVAVAPGVFNIHFMVPAAPCLCLQRPTCVTENLLAGCTCLKSTAS